MSPARLLSGLEERFRLLAGARDVDTRQRALAASLAWSWDLLSEPERLTLARASVFVGRIRPQAAEAAYLTQELVTEALAIPAAGGSVRLFKRLLRSRIPD